MNLVKLGASNISVSPVFQGTDLFGSKIDKETAFSLLDHYFEKGGNVIDTGNFYAAWLPGFVGGESETVVGEWLKARNKRDQAVICTKLGFDYPSSPGGLSASEIQKECDKSLKRLQTDRIDVYYAHKDDFNTPQQETMEAFHGLVKAGKVRLLGASNLIGWRIVSANTIAKLNNLTPYSVIQQRYTYLRPRHGVNFSPQIFLNEDLRNYAENEGIALVAYSILLQGAYTRADRPLPPQFAGPDSDDRLAALKQVATEIGKTPSQVLIAWLRQSSPSILPIIAGSKKEQYDENIEALDIKLTDAQMNTLTNASNPVIKDSWIQS